MKTFYFYTGVNPRDYPNSPTSIPFDCEDVPDNYKFDFACDNPNIRHDETCIVREIHNSRLLSKYAYFSPINLFNHAKTD